jgi:hypothetical protein
MRCTEINNPASSEIRAVMRFLRAENISAAEIHSELWAVSGQNVMSEGTESQWCRMLKAGRSGRPSVVSDNLVQSVDLKYVKDGASQFQNFHVNFHKFHAIFSTRLLQSG